MPEMTDNYKKCLAMGTDYQDFIALKLYNNGIPIVMMTSKMYQINYGENLAGIEIKFDNILKTTGNLFIEIKEKSNPANPYYVDSGIFRKDNTWLYGIGDYDIFYIFFKQSLQRFYERYHRKYMNNERIDFFYEEKTIKAGTSMGFIIKADWAEKNLAGKVLRFNNEKQGIEYERKTA